MKNGAEAKLSMTIVYLFGVTVSYFVNRRWIFNSKEKIRTTSWKYWLTQLLGYSINYFILYCFVDLLHFKYEYVQMLAFLVVAAFLFLMLRFYVFLSHQENVVK